MLNINATANKTRNTSQKGVHYLPTVRLSDNRRIGASYAYDGTTPAKGTLYPTSMNNASGIGSIQSLINTEYTGYSDFALDFDSYAVDEVKYKTAEDNFQKYKSIKGIKLAFVQSPIALSTSGLFNNTAKLAKQKIFPLTSNTFVMVYFQSGGTVGLYAVVGSVNTSTGEVTYGTPALLNATSSLSGEDYLGLTEIGTGRYAMVVHQTETTLRNIIFTASGTTISVGTGVDITVGSVTLGQYMIRTEKVDTDKYVTIYGNSSGGLYRTYVTTVSGTVPTNGGLADAFGGASSYGCDIVMNTPTSGAFLGQDSSKKGWFQAFTISATTITFGTYIVLNNNSNTFDTTTYYRTPRMVLPNGIYYISCNIGSYGYAYYVSVSGTVSIVIDKITQVLSTGSSYQLGNYEVKINTNKWVTIQYSSSGGSYDYLWEFNYETTTGKIYTVRKDLINNNLQSSGINMRALVVLGNQYLLVGCSSTAGTSLYHSVNQVGSCEVYFEDEVTPCATISNPSVGWAYSWAMFTKAINKTIAYFSLKNKTGNTVFINTSDWLFEVE